MALTVLGAVKNLIGSKFSLADIKGFPQEIYDRQYSVYSECENWFKGTALADQPTSAGQTTEMYPLRINPAISTVLKHAYILFGEVSNDGRPLVVPKLIPENDKQVSKDRVNEAEEALNTVWWENNGRALMLENGILSQIYGGCVFRALYVPWEGIEFGGWRRIPIRIERLHPKSFIGRPNAGDNYRLKEAWVVSNMPLEEARKWGYTGSEQNPTYIEYWGPNEHKAWVNKDEAIFPIPIPDQDGTTEFRVGEINKFGFVPLVYIPHLRIGGFHGMNAFDHLKGIIKELNLRFADYGDAVNDDSHGRIGMKNVQGTPQVRRIANGLEVIDLGGTAGITGNEAEPDLFSIGDAKASSSMKELLGELVDQYRRDSFVPAVAEGEDEGSQRSALTLATRFWPLTSHAGMERIFFSTGLDVFNSYLLQMMAVNNLAGITPKHCMMRMKQQWAPMLPRDREAEVQEMQVRSQEGIASIEHLLEMARDIDDIETERENIIKWQQEIAAIEAEAAAKAAQKFPPPMNPAGGSKDVGRPKTKPDKTPTEKRGGGGGKE